MKIKTLAPRVVGLLCMATTVVVGSPARADIVRYLDPIFAVPTDPITSLATVTYGSAPKFGGGTSTLLLDVWEGVGDTATGRAAIVFAHGGGFSNGTRFGP
ncbi:MAG TPA: hypothetical protein VI541_05105, partial [Actinomycetota bacterium]|nr:hypothetical protein [Actinomycetota bacterium]